MNIEQYKKNQNTMKTKFQDFINESNISKKRNFPTYKDTERLDKSKIKGIENNTDMYIIYNLPKKDIGKYLNTWFQGEHHESNDVILRDELWTVKKVDKETSEHLYDRYYNPISLTIMCPTGGKNSKFFGEVFNMKAQIHSVDDSSYGMWFNHKSLEELNDIKQKLMVWLDSKSEVNGQEWFDYGKELGADDFDMN